MFTVRVEHVVDSYDAWKKMYDDDPLDRKGSGARAYRVMRPTDDEGAVAVDLDFATREEADAMVTALHTLWEGPAAAMLRDPRARVVEVVESGDV
jgi:hypothetical protein